MPAIRSGRHVQSATLRVVLDLAVEINFEFTFQYNAGVAFFAPVRLDEI